MTSLIFNKATARLLFCSMVYCNACNTSLPRAFLFICCVSIQKRHIVDLRLKQRTNQISVVIKELSKQVQYKIMEPNVNGCAVPLPYSLLMSNLVIL